LSTRIFVRIAAFAVRTGTAMEARIKLRRVSIGGLPVFYVIECRFLESVRWPSIAAVAFSQVCAGRRIAAVLCGRLARRACGGKGCRSISARPAVHRTISRA